MPFTGKWAKSKGWALFHETAVNSASSISHKGNIQVPGIQLLVAQYIVLSNQDLGLP